MRKSGLSVFFVIFLSIVLAACGGGGSNSPPVASAGPTQTVNEVTTVNLDGRDSSDLGGKIAAYQWTQVSGDAVALVNANTATPTFTAPTVSNAEGSKQLVFKLKVTDDGGASDEATVKIIVSAVNGGLDAYAGENQKVVEGAAVKLSGVGTDEDGDVVTYKWVQVSGTTVTLTGANTATPSFTSPSVASNENSNLLEFRLTVTDSSGATATDTVIVAVTIANKPPIANAGADLEVGEGVTVKLSGSATDANNDSLSYSWIQTAGKYAVLLNGANTTSPSFTSPDVTATATLTFMLTVNDGRGAMVTDTVIVTVKDTPNIAPVANAGTDQTNVGEKTPVTLNGNGSSDADGSIASYAWRQTSGVGVTLVDADKSRVSFTAPQVLSGSQTLLFRLTVTDDLGKTAEDTVSITVNAVNDAPVANAGVDQAVYEGATVRLAGNGTDEDGDALTYSWSAPAGITLVNATTATPSFAVAEVLGDTNLTFTLTVRDSKGSTGSDSVVIAVRNLTIVDAYLPKCFSNPLPSGVALYNLTNLSCNKNPAVDLSLANLAELGKLAHLQVLDLGNTKISDISKLLELGGLTELSLGNNKITSISGLSALPNLTRLDLNTNPLGNSLSYINELSTLHNLQWLDLSNTQINSSYLALVTWSSLTKLQSLFLSGNTFTSIDTLKVLINLTELNLSTTTLDDADLPNIAVMTKLQKLNLSTNKIKSLSALLPSPSSLQNLFIAGNCIPVVDLDALPIATKNILDVNAIDWKQTGCTP